ISSPWRWQKHNCRPYPGLQGRTRIALNVARNPVSIPYRLPAPPGAWLTSNQFFAQLREHPQRRPKGGRTRPSSMCRRPRRYSEPRESYDLPAPKLAVSLRQWLRLENSAARTSRLTPDVPKTSAQNQRHEPAEED